MPRNRDAKTLIRQYQAEHGVPYSEAARRLGYRDTPSAFFTFVGFRLGDDFTDSEGNRDPLIPLPWAQDGTGRGRITVSGGPKSGKSALLIAIAQQALRDPEWRVVLHGGADFLARAASTLTGASERVSVIRAGEDSAHATWDRAASLQPALVLVVQDLTDTPSVTPVGPSASLLDDSARQHIVTVTAAPSVGLNMGETHLLLGPSLADDAVQVPIPADSSRNRVTVLHPHTEAVESYVHDEGPLSWLGSTAQPAPAPLTEVQQRIAAVGR